MSCDDKAVTDSSSASCAPLAQVDRRTFEIEVIADRAPIVAPFASFCRHLIGYARPAWPTFTAGGLSIGEKKPCEARERFEEAAAVFRGSHAGFLGHVATGNLGRLAAREGRFDDAEQALEDALNGFGELNAATFVMESLARLAELDVLRGDRQEQALERAEATLDAVRKSGGSPLETMLLRLVGYARAQAGLHGQARAAFEESLVAAHEAEAEYEQALAHRALADIGEDVEENDALSRKLLGRLGVVSVPSVPLP